MPTYYEISATHDAVSMRDGKGAASFAVRNVGARPAEARAVAVPMQGAQESWLKVEEPSQRPITPDQTHAFKVDVTVPPGTSPGRYGLRLDVVSVDNPDEEYDRGPVVIFEVVAAKAPEPERGFPWWAVALAAGILILAILGITWWLNDDSGSGRVVIPPSEPDVEPIDPPVAETDADESGSFVVEQTFSGDFESGSQISSHSPKADFWYRARSATDRVINPRGSTKFAILGRSSPSVRAVKSVLRQRPIEEISVENLRPGFWIAARTNEGNFAAFTLESQVGPSPSSMELRYLLWENR